VNRPPNDLPGVGKWARVLETSDGRLIVTRLAETIVLELHRGSLALGKFDVRFVEITHGDARALAIMLEELAK
jgi:hypothetical protein